MIYKPLVFGVLVFASGLKTVLVKLTCLRTRNYVTNLHNHLHGVGWGGLLTSFLITTARYVTNFFNHLHGVGWDGVGWLGY